MDKCIVCLTPHSSMFGINSKSSEWQKNNIQRIIEKHLWWWYNKQSSPLHWICRQCWWELLSFHAFFTKVEKAHKQYVRFNVEKISEVHSEDAINPGSVVAKEEYQNFDELLFLDTFKPNRKEYTSKAPPADVVHDVTIKNLEAETLELQCYDSLDFSLNDDKPQISKHSTEENENEGGQNLILVKEEFQVLECSLTSTNEDLNQLDTSKTMQKKISSEVIKDKEASCYLKNQIAKSLNTPENKKQNKSTKAEVECTENYLGTCTKRSELDIEYINKKGFKFFCHLCKKPLTNFGNLKTHFRLEHDIVGYAVCCNKKFYTRGTLADHLRVHEDPNYFKCQSCGKIMLNRKSFETHMASHKLPTSGSKPVFHCDKCDKFFPNKAIYNRHISLHVPYEERKFQCEECNKKFGAEHLLKLHKTFAHQKRYCKICEICGKSFRERFSFKRHMDEHNGKPFTKIPCDLCGVELTNKYLLNRHKKFMHTEENLRSQVCPHCSKVSPNMASHRQHVFYNHTMQRKHACNICDKKFKRALKLKEHLSTHTGEPLFKCSFCPLTFISKSKMYKHRKNVHPNEWQELNQTKASTQKLRIVPSIEDSSNERIE